jgi:hypothetical protein
MYLKRCQSLATQRRLATHLLSSIKIVSIVFSLFQLAKHGNPFGSTIPFRGLTQGRLT